MSKVLPLLAFLLLAASSLVAGEAEDNAVAAVEKLGGVIHRDDKLPGHPVVGVDLSETQVTDADLKGLAALTNLTDLHLGHTKITNAGLKHLAGCKELTKLSTSLHMTNAGLKELANIKKLSSLKVCTRYVTNDGIKDLAALKNLTSIDFYRAEVDATGVAELREALPNCKISSEHTKP